MAALKIVRPIPIEIFGIKLIAYLASDGNLYVNFKDMCKQIGLEYSGQLERIKRDTIIYDKHILVPMDNLNQVSIHKRDNCLLAYRAALYWMMTTQHLRLNKEIRPSVLMLKEYLADMAGLETYHELCEQTLTRLELLYEEIALS